MMRHVAMLAALGLAAAPSALAQRVPSPAEVDRVFAAYDRAGSPGCALGVSREGRMLYERGYGEAELEWGIPITPATVLNIGSTSKQFVAAAIVLLAEQGKLSLDDDVRKYIPELPRYDAPITLRHLLHHTSGIRDLLELMVFANQNINAHYPTEEYIGILARQKELNFTPGSQHLYSNSGYVLLGVVVQRASGQSLREFTERTIFAPLGMRDTHFHDDRLMVMPRRALSYAPARGGFVLSYSTDFDRVGSGGLHTTVRDLARWDHAFATGAVGGPRFAATMLERGVLTNGDTIPYALALTHGTLGRVATISHSGASLGFRAEHLRLPAERLAVSVLCNLASANPGDLARRVAALYVPEATVAAAAPMPMSQPAPVTLDAAALAAHVGEYRSEELGTSYRVAMRDGRLVLRGFGESDVPITPVATDRFRAAFGTLEFQREGGRVRAFRLQGGRARNILFRRVGD